jgi:hypothetical protein
MISSNTSNGYPAKLLHACAIQRVGGSHSFKFWRPEKFRTRFIDALLYSRDCIICTDMKPNLNQRYAHAEGHTVLKYTEDGR